MALGVCLIATGNPGTEFLTKTLENCGLCVWTPQSPNALEGYIYDQAVCLIIDLPGDAATGLVRLFRFYGIRTPALLIVDPDCIAKCEMADGNRVLDVIPRDASPLRLLRWVQSICAAKRALNRMNWREDRLSA